VATHARVLRTVEAVFLAVVGGEVEHVADAVMQERRDLEPPARGDLLGQTVDGERAVRHAHRGRGEAEDARGAHIHIETEGAVEALARVHDRAIHLLAKVETQEAHRRAFYASRMFAPEGDHGTLSRGR
jgi:hypothetical protein